MVMRLWQLAAGCGGCRQVPAVVQSKTTQWCREATEVMPGSRKPAGSSLFNGAGKELERGVKQDMAIGVLLM